MVAVAHRLAIAGLFTLALAIVGVVLLILDVVAGRTVGLAVAATIAVVITALWLLLPVYVRGSHGDVPATSDEHGLFS